VARLRKIHLTLNPELIRIGIIMTHAAPAGTIMLSATQARVLASPARLEIVEAFGALGRASARELAAHLGRSPGAVYHHVRALEQAGIVREVARRPGTRRPEAVYAATGRRFAVAANPSRAGDQSGAGVLKSVLRQAARDADRGLAAGPEALKDRFHGLQLSAVLAPADVRRVLRRLAEIETTLRKANRVRSRSGEIFRWTSLFMPIGRSRS
jgi:DNA-binding transcriptional ArsR family regulator